MCEDSEAVSVIIIKIVMMAIVVVAGVTLVHVLLPVLIAEATGGDTVKGIEIELEMTTNAGIETEILVDLPKKEANTILAEDIDMTYHPNQTLFTGQPSYANLLKADRLLLTSPDA